MIGYRLLIKFRKTRDEPPAWMLLALSVVVSALTFIAEAIGIGIVFHVSPFMRVLQSAFDIDFDDLSSIRPGWLVLGAGLIVVAVDLVRARFGKRRSRRGLLRLDPRRRRELAVALDVLAEEFREALDLPPTMS